MVGLFVGKQLFRSGSLLTVTEKTCPNCKTAFVPVARHQHQIYCNSKCRAAYWARQHRRHIPYEAICERCGEPFIRKNKGKRQRFCSKYCQQKAWAENNHVPPPKYYGRCPECGGKFIKKAWNHRFCSPLCRDKHAYDRRRERELARVHRRIARKKNVVDDLTDEQIAEKFQTGRCFYCGRRVSLTLDHFYPLFLGGPTSRANIVVACKQCNSSKGHKPPDEYITQLAFGEGAYLGA